MLEFSSTADGEQIPVYFVTPTNRESPAKAVVVLHGSGGLWNDQDSNGDGVGDICDIGSLTAQFREWESLLREKGYAVAFPDSYSTRNTCENEGAFKSPPLKFTISATFIRNHDAIGTLQLLKQLVWEDSGLPVIDIKNVALLGFSDGGSAVLSSIYDVNATPANWKWKQSFDGVDYTKEIREPIDSELKFKTAVVYYPGSYHNGYYGNVCGTTGIYQSYCDIMFNLPEDDALTENSECLVASMVDLGGGIPSVEHYSNTGHGFDSNDQPESAVARNKSLQFLQQQLKGE
ncbi:MAG TPA: hypothetical protein VGD40_10965 [Chryseosolibacter sp.]